MFPSCRSLGDLDFKEPARFVESEPDVLRLPLRRGDGFVVLGSDGLWDVMSDEDAVSVADQVLKVGGAGQVRVWVTRCQWPCLCHLGHRCIQVGAISEAAQSPWMSRVAWGGS